MRKMLLLLVLFVRVEMCFGEDTKALVARLHEAQSQTSLQDAGLKPWHLKLAVQDFDPAGARDRWRQKGTPPE